MILRFAALTGLLGCGPGDGAATTGDGSDGPTTDNPTTDAPTTDTPTAAVDDHTLFVGLEGSIVGYLLSDLSPLSGTVTNTLSPTDLYALDDGTLFSHLTGSNEVVVADGALAEISRFPSSLNGFTRPVHAYLSPVRGDGSQTWVTMNDGEGVVVTSGISLIDATSGSPTFGQMLGDIGVGNGHHTGGFAPESKRLIVGALSECVAPLTVVDYADPSAPSVLATFSSADLGQDGSSFPKTCDVTFATGLPTSPNGCSTSDLTGETWCNVSSHGAMAIFDLEANPPSLTELLDVDGSGGGYTQVTHDGAWMLTVQDGTREGAGGVACQVGSLLIFDAATHALTDTVPMLLDGPSCTRSLIGTDEETLEPNKLVLNHEGSRIFVTLAGGFGVADARVRDLLVYDLDTMGHATQLDSVTTGESTGFLGSTLSGDENWYFVADNISQTVSIVDAHSLAVTTLSVPGVPKTVASWGTAQGPSHQHGPF